MGGQKGPSQSVTNTENELIQSDIGIAEQQQTNANTLFTDIGLPGLTTAQSYYDKLASGNPQAIQTAVGPAEAGIDTQTAGTVKNIQNTTPKGGVQQLGEEEAQIAGAGQKGNLITQAYTSAFPALANLGSGTTELSQSAIAQALQGFQGAASTTNNLGEQQAQGKASQLAFFGALAGAGGEVAGAACWIAARIFGFSDVRTYMVRAWLRRVFSQRLAGRIVMPLYRRYGRQAARSERFCEMLKPLFEMALGCAVRDMSPSLGLMEA